MAFFICQQVFLFFLLKVFLPLLLSALHVSFLSLSVLFFFPLQQQTFRVFSAPS